MNLDWSAIITSLGTITFVYGFLRNFKNDVNDKIDCLENKISSLEERIFWLASSKHFHKSIQKDKPFS